MCNVLSFGLLAGLNTAYGLYGQRETAKAQVALIEEQRRNALEEIQTKASVEMGERIRAARREAARRRVAAGEAGISGQSLDLDIANTFGEANHDLGAIARDAAYASRAANMRARSEHLGVRKPSILGAGLQIATSGLSAYHAAGGFSHTSGSSKSLKIRK